VQAAQLAEKPTSLLEEQLFKASPVLVKLYALHDPFKLPVVSMLEVLISSAASIPDNEPPSLVGHLGAESSCLFLDVLSQLDKPLGDTSLQLAIWQLLSTFVSKRQQWLAVFILTGASPRQTLKKGVSSDGLRMRSAPFLQMALEKLSHIDQLEPQVALALLEFVSRAQENWPWATPHIGKHHQFFTSIINHVSKMKINKLSVMDQIYSTRIAAVVADLCAVYMHSAKEVNDRSFIKTMIPLVSWFSDGAVEVSAYNASLHANLKKNFENRYSGCKIIDFKRTPLEARTPGQDYYYDLSMAEKLLSYDFAWAGSRNRGFVEAQVVSFYSYPSPALSYLTQYRIFSTAGSSSPLSIAQTSCPITKFESQWRLLRRTASLPILKAVLPRPSLKESSKRALTSLKLSSSGSLRWVLEVPRSSSSLKSPGRHCEPDTRHMKML
jgi:nuclear pore complex protein Nup188